MKVHFRKVLEGGALFGPYITPQIQWMINRAADPQERNDITGTTMTDTWAIGAALGLGRRRPRKRETLPPHQDRRRVHRLPETRMTLSPPTSIT